jgi:hypothetical protein
MSPANTNSQRVDEVDNFDDQWAIFLREHGLTTSKDVVKKVAEQVANGLPVYRLYSGKSGPPVAAKDTVRKIERKIKDGKLNSLLQHWGFMQLEKGEEDLMQMAHLRALRGFLQKQAATRSSFPVPETPSSNMGQLLLEVLYFGCTNSKWLGSTGWVSLPITKRIRNHCQQHRLWKNIDEWNRKNIQYNILRAKIANKLVGDFRRKQPYPENTLLHAQEAIFLLQTFDWLAGQLLGSVPSLPEPIKLPDDASGEGIPTNTVSIHSETWLRKALKRWGNSKDIRSVVHQYHYLQILGETIRKDMMEIDENTLAQGVCPDCPKAKPKQESKS